MNHQFSLTRNVKDFYASTSKIKNMSEQLPSSHHKEIYSCTDIEGFDALAELALNMRSSWNHAPDRVWRQLDPVQRIAV
jgi:hypothetical protein